MSALDPRVCPCVCLMSGYRHCRPSVDSNKVCEVEWVQVTTVSWAVCGCVGVWVCVWVWVCGCVGGCGGDLLGVADWSSSASGKSRDPYFSCDCQCSRRPSVSPVL